MTQKEWERERTNVHRVLSARMHPYSRHARCSKPCTRRDIHGNCHLISLVQTYLSARNGVYNSFTTIPFYYLIVYSRGEEWLAWLLLIALRTGSDQWTRNIARIPNVMIWCICITHAAHDGMQRYKMAVFITDINGISIYL